MIAAPRVPPANRISGQPISAAARPPLFNWMPSMKKLASLARKLSSSGSPKKSWEMPHSSTMSSAICHTLLPAESDSRPSVMMTAR